MAPSFHSVSASTRSLFAPNLFDSSRPTYGHGVRRFSLSDVVSNVLLCIPFGFLWVGGEFYLRMQLVLWRRATSRAFRPGKKLFLLGPLGFLIAAGNRDGSPRKQQALAATAGLLVGLILEAGQIALQSRNPSLTDVLLFGGAAWAGAAVFERYRRIRIPALDLSWLVICLRQRRRPINSPQQ